MTWSSRVIAASVIVLMTVACPVVAVAAQLTLTWTDASTGELGFAVERSTGSGGSFAEVTRTGPGVTIYTDLMVATTTTYCYRVRAFNAAGYSAYSDEACGTPATSVGLAVVKTGGGAGTVTSAPAGINCGATCSASYASGASVTLTATAAADSTFTGWTGGGCSGTGTCTVTVVGAITVTAGFALRSALAPSTSALGVTPLSLTFTKIVGQPNPPAQTVTVTAPPGQVWTTHDSMAFADVTGLPFNGSDGVNGTGSATFQVMPSSGMTSLSTGTYTGFITVSTVGSANIVISVGVIVTAPSALPPPAPPPAPPPPSATSLSVTPRSLTFTEIGGATESARPDGDGDGGSRLVWITHDRIPFADVAGLPFNGSDGVTGSGPRTFQIMPSAGMTPLEPRVYPGVITISTGGAATS